MRLLTTCSGPADLDVIRMVVKAVNIPVISNGNIRCVDDITKNLRFTGAAGVMSAECILKDPSLYAKLCRKNILVVKTSNDWENGAGVVKEEEMSEVWNDKKSEVTTEIESFPSTACRWCEANHEVPLIGDIALEYLELARKFPPPGTSDQDTVHTLHGLVKRTDLHTEAMRGNEGSIDGSKTEATTPKYLCRASTIEYATHHVVCFLQRTGKGKRTQYKYSGKFTPDEIRSKLASARALTDLEAIVRALLPYSESSVQ